MDRQENDSITSQTLKEITKKRKRSSIVESVVHIRKKIYNDKSKISQNTTQTISLSAPVSTSKEKVCGKAMSQRRPFWTKLSQDWSKKLLSFTKTDSVDMESKSWNSSFKSLGLNSWFTVKKQKLMTQRNSPTTCSQSQQFSLHDIMDDDPLPIVEDEQRKVELKAIKIRLFPTKEQQTILSKWFGTARWTYNQCVDSFQTKKVKSNKKDLRAKHINNDNFEDENAWVSETPYDIRDEGMNDFLKALKATKAKKDLKRFHFKFKSKKDSTQSITVLKKHWGHKRGVYSGVFDWKKMKAEMDLPEKLGYDSRLIKTRLNKYYLCIPKPIEVKSENQAPNSTKHCTISLDPGVRTFMTGYDADGSTFEWGQNDFGRIFRLCYAYDGLQAKWSSKEVNHHQRYRMKIAGLRIHSKIRNLVDEVHKKLVKCLCENYRKIVLPVFETSKMVKRGMRKLHKKTARAMLTWSHYRFRQRLLSKSREYPWCKVILTEEPYTSKTCGKCGTINAKLGSHKTFRCESSECDYVSDRDVNGARNILLRLLTIRGVGLPSDSVGATPLS